MQGVEGAATGMAAGMEVEGAAALLLMGPQGTQAMGVAWAMDRLQVWYGQSCRCDMDRVAGVGGNLERGGISWTLVAWVGCMPGKACNPEA